MIIVCQILQSDGWDGEAGAVAATGAAGSGGVTTGAAGSGGGNGAVGAVAIVISSCSLIPKLISNSLKLILISYPYIGVPKEHLPAVATKTIAIHCNCYVVEC